MEKSNRVTVRIYGQEYTLTGDLARDQIVRIAAYVDGKMVEMSKLAPSASHSQLAILAAVNAAEELFNLKGEVSDTDNHLRQLEKDSQHYAQLWEEAKKSFLQYKEDAQAANDQLTALKNQMLDVQMEMSQLKLENQELEEKADALQKKNDNLSQRLVAQEGDKESSVAQAKTLEAKYRELESSFFDLQMENIQLKGEIDRYKKIVE
jgi:cell division protein ZapA (FtsZ GTPase activity inhibitor)